MTTAHADPEVGDHAHDDDPAHAFDGEPIKTLPADEPPTPGWLPILGLVLFVGAGITMLVTAGDAPPSDAAPAKTGEAAAPPAAPNPPTAPARPTAPDGTLRPDPQAAASAAAKLNPDQIKQLQQMIDQERTKRGLPPIGALGSAAPSAGPSAAAPPSRGPARLPVRPPAGRPAH